MTNKNISDLPAKIRKIPTRVFNLLFDGIDKVLEFIFGKPTEIPKGVSGIDFDIYDANGDYDPEKIAAIDKERISLAYDSGIAMMREINDGIKVINTRTTLLLGYLSAIVATLAPLLVKGFFESGALYIWIVLATYLILIFVVSYLLTSPSLTAPSYNEPRKFMKKELLQYDIKLIKLFEIDLLQSRIYFSNIEQKRRGRYLRNAIFATFIIPITALVDYFTIDYLISAL